MTQILSSLPAVLVLLTLLKLLLTNLSQKRTPPLQAEKELRWQIKIISSLTMVCKSHGLIENQST